MPAGRRFTADDLISSLISRHDLRSADDIPNELLEYIYRLRDAPPPAPESDELLLIEGDDKLEGTSENGPAAIRRQLHGYIACDNLWISKDTVKAALEVASKSRIAKGGSSNGCAVSGKRRKLGKGKERSDGINNIDHECSPEACHDNPRCLNWLGQADWEDGDRAYKAFARQWGLGDNPHLELRDPDLPVGLKNLGATCYVNSFLQVWFRDPAFRNGVFACSPSSSKPFEQQPLFQLQVLFAALQAGPYRAFSPVDLVKSLGLDDQEQQDAQEFAKLFMELLDDEFKKQPDAALRNLVTSQFEGQMKYTTRCLKCSTISQRASTYREIEIALRKAKSLKEGFLELLMTEVLCGDNQYHCECCDSLHNAERYLTIDSLPPVIHISLLRFYYDIKSGSRKKSSVAISYPLSIDMQPYVGERSSITVPPLWYDLRAVLLHEGTSAMYGHYTAQIYDSSQSKWFHFDDDSVHKQDLPMSAGVNTLAQKSDNEVSRCNTRTKRKTVVDCESDGDEVVFCSTSSIQTNGGGRALRNPTPSRLAFDSSNLAENDASGESIIITDSEEDKTSNNIRSRASSERSSADKQSCQAVTSRNAYMLVYVRRDSTATHISGSRIDVNVRFEALKKLYDDESARTAALSEFDNKEKRCQEEFAQVLSAKRSVYERWADCSDEASSFLVDAAQLSNWLVGELRSRGKSNLIPGHASSRLPATEAMSALVAPMTKGTTAPTSVCIALNGHDAHVAGSNPLPDNRIAQQSSCTMESTIRNFELQCRDHDISKISLKAAAKYKRISQLTFAQLQSRGVVIEPVLTTNDLCRRCAWRTYADDEYRIQHAEHLRKFHSLESNHADAVWISKVWLDEWKKSTPQLEADDDLGNDIGPHEAPYFRHVECDHGLLSPVDKRSVIIPGRQAKFLRSLFPAWQPWLFSEPECRQCQLLSAEEQQRQQDLIHIAKQIRTSDDLARIVKPVLNKLSEIAESYKPRHPNEACNLVPQGWMKSWIKWLKAPQKEMCPMAVDFRSLVCEHNGLTVDINISADRGKMVVLSEPEWTTLMSYEP